MEFLNRTFKHVGNATKNPKYAKGVKFQVDDNLDGALSVVYIFVNEDEKIVYVGETGQSLKGRMGRYTSNHAATNRKMREYVETISSLKIYATVVNSFVDDHGVTVNMRLSVEETLINSLSPLLNKKGK